MVGLSLAPLVHASTTRNRSCTPIGVRGKLSWFANCLLDNCFDRGGPSDGTIQSLDFVLPPLETLDAALTWSSSPSRLYADAVWLSLPWPRIASALGGEVRALEIGCGSGSKFNVLAEILQTSFVQYVGVDINRHEDWPDLERRDQRARFLAVDAETIPADIFGHANLVISQSALEHIPRDLRVFLTHRESVQTRSPVMQIHMVPAPVSLFLYLVHGYRQYARHTIRRITSLYPASQSGVLPLGGLRSDLLHLLFITLPLMLPIPDLRRRYEHVYANLLRSCFRRERFLNSRVPSFYCTILSDEGANPVFPVWQEVTGVR